MLNEVYPIMHAVQHVSTAAVLVHVSNIHRKFANSNKISFRDFLAYLNKFPITKKNSYCFESQCEAVIAPLILLCRGYPKCSGMVSSLLKLINVP